MGLTATLRKYNKHLLVVFCAFLMIAFLLPIGYGRMGNRQQGNPELGTAFNKPIHSSDLNAANAYTRILESLARMAEEPQYQRILFWQLPVQMSDQPLIDWYLLQLEADQLGVQISDQMVDTFIADAKISPATITTLRNQMKTSIATIRQAIASQLRIMRAFEMANSFPAVSEPQIRHLFYKILTQCQVRYVSFLASSYLDDVREPTDAELKAYFDEHLSRYRYADRVNVQYLKADIDQIKKTVTIPSSRVVAYYHENIDQFTIQPTTTQSTQPADTQPQVQPLDEVREQIIDTLKTAQARRLAAEAMNDLRRLVTVEYTSADRNEDGSVKDIDSIFDNYARLADAITADRNVPITYGMTGLKSMQELSMMPDIGRAFLEYNEQMLSLPQYAFNVVGLIDDPSDNPPGQRSQMPHLYLGKDTARFLRDRGMDRQPNNYYLFRVVAIDPAHNPETLDEVRADVLKDWQTQQALELARIDAEAFLANARNTDLDTAFEQMDDALKTKLGSSFAIQSPRQFAQSRMNRDGQLEPPFIAGISRASSKNFAEFCFELAKKLPATMPTTTAPAAQRPLNMVELDQPEQLCVVEVMNLDIPLESDYQMQRPFIVSRLQSMATQQAAMEWFNPQNIHERTRFQRKMPEENEES